MRMLEKNKRVCYYAYPMVERPIFDEDGNRTLETEIIYSEPVELKVNYSSAAGEESVEIFGSTTEYNRILAFSEDCPLEERYIMWLGVNPDFHKANYAVRRIADGKNSTLVAIQEII